MWATCPVEKKNSGALECTDDAAWQIHKSHDEAMREVRSGLLCCGTLMALFELRTLFEVEELKIKEAK